MWLWDNWKTVNDPFDATFKREVFREAAKRLNDRDGFVMNRYFEAGETLREIADSMGDNYLNKVLTSKRQAELALRRGCR